MPHPLCSPHANCPTRLPTSKIHTSVPPVNSGGYSSLKSSLPNRPRSRTPRNAIFRRYPRRITKPFSGAREIFVSDRPSVPEHTPRNRYPRAFPDPDTAQTPFALCLTRSVRHTHPRKTYSIPIDSSRLSSMNSIRSAPARPFLCTPPLSRRSTPDRILFIIGNFLKRRSRTISRSPRRRDRSELCTSGRLIRPLSRRALLFAGRRPPPHFIEKIEQEHQMRQRLLRFCTDDEKRREMLAVRR